MEVPYYLPRGGAVIDDDTVAFFIKALQLCDLPDSEKQVRHYPAVIFIEFLDPLDMLPVYDQDMNRRLGIDVLEGIDPVVFVHLRRRCRSGYDIAEKASHDGLHARKEMPAYPVLL